ncbi:harmonin-like isoform X3 [Rhopalosiphum padi]|uniref:harmonin-like isoform X3 n=1 Tax=Rhopalosiphum padi TaxID=40932 RepID=UPI00298D7A48|nr:harmonin-like isoform X3 [Rhopalosiphum padi]
MMLGGWGRSPGSSGSVPPSGQRTGHRLLPLPFNRTGGGSGSGGSGGRAAEAEDVMGHYGRNKGGVNKIRTGLYYSPPGTSYTILEKPPAASPPPPPPRATYLRESSAGVSGPNHPGTGSNSNRSNNVSSRGSSGKKRPISPEQVLKMFAAPNYSASSSYHVSSAKPQSPPPHGSNTSQPHNNTSSTIHNDNLTVRTISMSRPNATSGSPSNQGFGICVKGGADESNVGVYISRVEEGSIAESVGLKPGDSILEVNGRPFSTISHEEALKIFKSYRQITMTVKCPSPPQSMPTMHKKDDDENTNQDDTWGLTRTYSWINRKGQPVSPPLEYAKPISPYSKWSYTRSSKDKIRKVELVIEPGQSLGLMIRGGTEYNLGIFITGIDKESVADRSGLMIGDQILEVNGQSFLNLSHDEAVNQLKFQKQMTLTVRDVGKVPHSCTTYNPDTNWNHSLDNNDRKSEGKHSPMKTDEQSHRDMEVEEFEFSHQDYGDLETELLPRKYHNDLIDVGYTHRNSGIYDESNMTRSSSGYLEGLRSHLGGWTQKLKSWYYGSSLQLSNKHGRSYDGKNELLDEDGSYRRESGFIESSCSNNIQNESQIMLDQQGNLRIIVKKIKPLLGIAIEGGINTKHLLPRIINIHENGAAYEAGGLEVGQLILEVDGQKVEGMPHQEVARLIAESFAQTDKSEIEFLVVEAKKSNLEPKPTALIFLES